MALKDRIEFLTTPEEVDRFLARHPAAAIFKAGTCHKTNEGFSHVEARLGLNGALRHADTPRLP